MSRRRSGCVTTRRNVAVSPAADLVQRHFTATAPRELSGTDTTYIPTWAGLGYLAVVLDVFSRNVVGWAFGQRQTTELVPAALNMALQTRRPGRQRDPSLGPVENLYESRVRRALLDERVRPSMGSVGDACDNAMAKSFFASLECELNDRRVWKTFVDARLEILTWIEGWYDRRPRHSALEYLSSINLEARPRALSNETAAGRSNHEDMARLGASGGLARASKEGESNHPTAAHAGLHTSSPGEIVERHHAQPDRGRPRKLEDQVINRP